jgi:hypothetical protein
MGQRTSALKPVLRFFNIPLHELNDRNVKTALDIFTRQPTPIPGYETVSLREMQRMFLANNVNNPEIMFLRFLETVSNKETTQIQFVRDFTQAADSIQQWYNSNQFPILVLGTSEKERETRIVSEEGRKVDLLVEWHATTMIVIKKENKLLLTYFNSNPTRGSEKLGNQIFAFIKTRINPNVTLHVRNEDTCPAFQMGGQGGNCTLWQLFILCLFILNPQFLETPNEIFQFIEKQNPTYCILLFEMFIWYKFCITFPNYFQRMLQFSVIKPNSFLKVDLYNDLQIRFLLMREPLHINFCPMFTPTQCLFKKNESTCNYEAAKRQCLYKDSNDTIERLQLQLQSLMQALLGDTVKTVVYQFEKFVYDTTPFPQVCHYTCSLLIDFLTFFKYFETTNKTLQIPRLYTSSLQVNYQCPLLFKKFLTIFAMPDFFQCLDHVYKKNYKLINTKLLSYHCPTASKLKYILSKGKTRELHVPTRAVSLYDPNNQFFNITFSSHLVELEVQNRKGLPDVAVIPQPIDAYNYVLFSKPSVMDYLDRAVWNGFLNQMLLQDSIQSQLVAQVTAETNLIPYFPSLLTLPAFFGSD